MVTNTSQHLHQQHYIATKKWSKFNQINRHCRFCACVCVYVRSHHAGIFFVLWSLSNDSWHVILLWLCADAQHALIRRYFVRWTMATDTPLCHFLQEKMCWNSSVCFPKLLFFLPGFCRSLCPPRQPSRSRFKVQSGILINWPVL